MPLIAFPYYGGKNSQLSWLLPLLPQTERRVSPFGGSAAVLLNMPIAKIEVYNDLDKEVVDFFKVLRDNYEDLNHLLQLTPYSREEFIRCRDADPVDDKTEMARRFFVKARQSFMGTRRSWATSLQVRNGWSQMLSRWTNGIEGLEPIVTRIKHYIIECRPALEIIYLYDTPETFMYLDPPYLHSTRTTQKDYAFEMSEQDHIELLDQINLCDSKIAISGYDNDLYNKYLKDWFRFDDVEKQLAGPRGFRKESLWTNYDYSEIREMNQRSILDFGKV